jgi:hypothetical protein
MPSQVDFDKVKRCIIDPMARHWNADLDSDTQADFVDDLARFSEETLKKAMQTLREEQKRKPSLAHVMEACKKFSPSRKDIPGNTDLECHKREINKQKMVTDYVASYRNSTLYLEAYREGWDLDLLAYVYAVADVQAQMILGYQRFGWDGPSIFGYGELTDDTRNSFFKDQRRQAQIGTIDVGIPTTRIAEWKRWAEWRKAHPTKDVKESLTAAKSLNAGLDEYLEKKMSA